MAFKSTLYLLLFSLIIWGSCSDSIEEKEVFGLQQLFLDNNPIDISSQNPISIPTNIRLELIFSSAVDITSFQDGITLNINNQRIDLIYSSSTSGTNIVISTKSTLEYNSIYQFRISGDLKNLAGISATPLNLDFKTLQGNISISSLVIDDKISSPFNNLIDISLNPIINIDFDAAVNMDQIISNISLTGPSSPSYAVNPTGDNKKIQLIVNNKLESWSEYKLSIASSSLGLNGENFAGIERSFFTTIDSTKKHPSIPTEELVEKVQSTTFKYFWDFAHPNSGLARERNTSNDLVTSGGSGFGLMAIIVGIENGLISREEGINRWEKILNFLEGADRFHGAWSHWINGNTGTVIPFSANDNGGDLVETSFLIQGMITVRQYLNEDDLKEKALIEKINQLWNDVEWDWYTKGGEKVLYWHWSPNLNWAINLKIRGHNETLITYILAASSPTHSISAETYHQGYARSGGIKNGKEFFDYLLPLGSDYGGPLFFTHYSFIGLDPRNLKDQYADYWQQNKNHTLINREWCIRNSKDYLGYSEDCWGLTASDNHEGYSAHSPNNDKGVITPTAAISSIPYAPEESIKAIEFFYYVLGDKIWGEYGFYDAFNPTEDWYARSYLAIDQGPIVCMIENYKTGLLWDLFMSAPEIKTGLNKLGFTY